MSYDPGTPITIGNPVFQLNGAAGALVGDPGPGNSAGLLQFEILNSSAATVAVACSAASAAAAQALAVVPAANTLSATNVMVLGAGVTKVITAAPGQFWASSATGVFIQSGTGN